MRALVAVLAPPLGVSDEEMAVGVQRLAAALREVA